jgi:hypothetical protein
VLPAAVDRNEHFCQRHALFIFPDGKMGAVWQHSFAECKSVCRIALSFHDVIAILNFVFIIPEF